MLSQSCDNQTSLLVKHAARFSTCFGGGSVSTGFGLNFLRIWRCFCVHSYNPGLLGKAIIFLLSGFWPNPGPGRIPLDSGRRDVEFSGGLDSVASLAVSFVGELILPRLQPSTACHLNPHCNPLSSLRAIR